MKFTRKVGANRFAAEDRGKKVGLELGGNNVSQAFCAIRKIRRMAGKGVRSFSVEMRFQCNTKFQWCPVLTARTHTPSYHGELDYMAREDRVVRRKQPDIILPRTKSVIMVGMHYWPGRNGFPKLHDVAFHKDTGMEPESLPADWSQRGVVSSYAWGRDYHEILGERLKRLGTILNEQAGGLGRFYVDTGAILERDFAERAGLGFVGKNTLLINAKTGSGFFIGELFSTVALPLDGDSDRGTVAKIRGKPGCGSCTKCMTACPTGAIVDEFVVDARRCISYLTIELKGSIPMQLREKMGNKVYGCDICQQVCPWNKLNWEREEGIGQHGFSPLFGSPSEEVTTPQLSDLLMLSEEAFNARFERSAIRRIGRDRMARNAAVALGNVGRLAELAVLKQVAEQHESDMVREHARWACEQIEKRHT